MTNEEIQKSLNAFRETDICKANRLQLAHMIRRREVYQYDRYGKQIAVFKHRKEAAQITGIHESGIGAVCIGKLTHTNGFVFSYGPRKFTEDELVKIQESVVNSAVKQVVMYDTKGNLVQVHANVTEAIAATGLDDISIRYSCSEKRNWKGYEWRWAEQGSKIPKKIKIPYKNNGTEVIVYNENKELVGEFSSVAAAAKHLGYLTRPEQRYFSSTFNKNRTAGINKPIKGYYFEIKQIVTD
jgi:hypothetical protein